MQTGKRISIIPPRIKNSLSKIIPEKETSYKFIRIRLHKRNIESNKAITKQTKPVIIK